MNENQFKQYVFNENKTLNLRISIIQLIMHHLPVIKFKILFLEQKFIFEYENVQYIIHFLGRGKKLKYIIEQVELTERHFAILPGQRKFPYPAKKFPNHNEQKNSEFSSKERLVQHVVSSLLNHHDFFYEKLKNKGQQKEKLIERSGQITKISSYFNNQHRHLEAMGRLEIDVNRYNDCDFDELMQLLTKLEKNHAG